MEQLTEKQLRALLQAPESRRLLELLQSGSGNGLRQAVKAAGSGNFSAVEQLLNTDQNSAELKALSRTLKQKLE